MVDNQFVVFTDGDLELDVKITPEQDTVWLSLDQLAELFDKNKSTISRHIKNIFAEGELLSNSVVANFATTASDGKTYNVSYYNLDVIISVGYRVKSPRGIAFRRWASGVLKQYLLAGYAVNEKRLAAMNKVIQIQSGIIAGAVGINAADVLKVIQEYSRALQLLDDYDHQCVTQPEGTVCTYRLQYNECMDLVHQMDFAKDSTIFGTEKEPGKLEGILSAIYQSAFGQDVYPTLEEKAANLLYFIIKDHAFNDGCKRIGAALFLHFLNKNAALYRNGKQTINESTLAAITLLVAESDPKEKDVMVQIIMNFLNWETGPC
ncbi:MAG: virulence RhuM family protein [Acidaminococcaceae bacterium]|nr:virulence RhuM family protein [Acidaminococcaceae bacterium]